MDSLMRVERDVRHRQFVASRADMDALKGPLLGEPLKEEPSSSLSHEDSADKDLLACLDKFTTHSIADDNPFEPIPLADDHAHRQQKQMDAETSSPPISPLRLRQPFRYGMPPSSQQLDDADDSHSEFAEG